MVSIVVDSRKEFEVAAVLVLIERDTTRMWVQSVNECTVSLMRTTYFTLDLAAQSDVGHNKDDTENNAAWSGTELD